MPTLAEVGRQLEVKRAELHQIFEKAKTDQIDPLTGLQVFNMDATVLQEVQGRNEELKTLNDQFERMRLADIQQKNIAEMGRLNEIERNITPAGAMKFSPGGKPARLSDMVIDSVEYKGRASTRNRFSVELADVDLKSLMIEGSGFPPSSPRTDKIVLSAQRRPVVGDLIPTDTTTLAVIKWMEEKSFANSADTVAEAGLKPESWLEYVEKESAVRKIATWLPITEEQLDDVPGLRNLIDNRLSLMILLTEEDQLLNGNGVAPDLLGFLNHTSIQSQAKGADAVPDTVYKAMTKVRWVSFAEPSAIIMNPNDWQDVRLLRTADGIYIFGNPNEEVEARMWGKPVIVTTAITENTGLTGDFVLYSHISRKMGLRIDVSDSHDTYFVYNKLAIRAEMRESLEIYRGSAFCKMTGI